MKTILIALLLTSSVLPLSASAFIGEKKLMKHLERQLENDLMLSSSLTDEVQPQDDSNESSWILSRIRVMTYPLAVFGIGIFEVKVKPMVEIRWERKPNPNVLRDYQP